ncbi:hypothetical protein L211DRAFT_269680 [Terfezia boudieri ATCC MYA-4762]|uniref:Uncharacterized protein n=1 Tax=Terfezia boudieri ATCC MYA-4762 TaxID=1051890 RepID=A0A3N4LPK9_9PEZI|nr:hypothetical protein L211DRAFT_269680 [Terfezia boudieri ATCC MYA-4762]
MHKPALTTFLNNQFKTQARTLEILLPSHLIYIQINLYLVSSSIMHTTPKAQQSRSRVVVSILFFFFLGGGLVVSIQSDHYPVFVVLCPPHTPVISIIHWCKTTLMESDIIHSVTF